MKQDVLESPLCKMIANSQNVHLSLSDAPLIAKSAKSFKSSES
jgi:hypothetical protein